MKLNQEIREYLEWWAKHRDRIYTDLNRPEVRKTIEELRRLEASGELEQMQQGLKILKESGLLVDDEVKIDNDGKPRTLIDAHPVILLPLQEKSHAKISKLEAELSKMRGKKISKENLILYREILEHLKAQQDRGEQQNVTQVSRTMQNKYKWTEKQRANFVRAFTKSRPKLQLLGL